MRVLLPRLLSSLAGRAPPCHGDRLLKRFLVSSGDRRVSYRLRDYTGSLGRGMRGLAQCLCLESCDLAAVGRFSFRRWRILGL